MATLWISEYVEPGGRGGRLPIPDEPPVAEQTVDFTGGEAKSAAFNDATTYILVVADVKWHMAIGASPTASTANKPLPADSPMFFGVQIEAGHVISALAA